MRLRFVFSELSNSLRRNSLMMFAVVVITAFSMLILSAALLVRSQVNITKHSFYQKLQVSVWLCPENSPHPQCPTQANDVQIQAIQSQLNSLRPLVTNVDFVDQDQAWSIFKDLFANQPDLINNTDPKALPESFVVKLSDPKKFDVISTAVKGMPGVDIVQNQDDFLHKLFGIMNAVRFTALAATGVLIVAAGVLIGVAVQVAAASRRRETGIMRLVGASRLYIQLPFLLEGVLAALIGALIGFAGVAAIKHFLVDGKLKAIVPVLGGRLIGWAEVYATLPWLIGLSVVVAALASFVTLRRYLTV
jgi:cell division transport system permease protein